MPLLLLIISQIACPPVWAPWVHPSTLIYHLEGSLLILVCHLLWLLIQQLRSFLLSLALLQQILIPRNFLLALAPVTWVLPLSIKSSLSVLLRSLSLISLRQSLSKTLSFHFKREVLTTNWAPSEITISQKQPLLFLELLLSRTFHLVPFLSSVLFQLGVLSRSFSEKAFQMALDSFSKIFQLASI